MKVRYVLLLAACSLGVASLAQAQIICDSSDPSTNVVVASTGGGSPANNTYKVTFCGSAYDGLTDETTFKYKVEEVLIKNGLSHWTLALCQRALDAYVSGSATPSSGVETGKDGQLGITGIKWNVGGGWSAGEFTFRLSGMFTTEPVAVLAKGGGHHNTSTIEGPSCASTACLAPQAPSYDGGYVLNAAQDKAFIKVDVPEGATAFEFYNTQNLTVGDPVGSPESTTTLAGLSRTGMTFSFADGQEPTVAYFPISRANPNTKGVAFYLRVTDDCGQVVDVDPSFALAADAGDAAYGLALSASPNPASTHTTLRYSVEVASPLEIVLHDALGRQVRVLEQRMVEAGTYTLLVDTADLPAGIYLYRITTSGHSLTRTLTVVR